MHLLEFSEFCGQTLTSISMLLTHLKCIKHFWLFHLWSQDISFFKFQSCNKRITIQPRNTGTDWIKLHTSEGEDLYKLGCSASSRTNEHKFHQIFTFPGYFSPSEQGSKALHHFSNVSRGEKVNVWHFVRWCDWLQHQRNRISIQKLPSWPMFLQTVKMPR